MKKEILITLCCAGLMLVTPLTCIAQENKVNNSLSEQIDVNGLVVQIKTVMNEILEKYGHIPFVSNFCKIIINLSNIIGKIIFCIVILFIFIPFAILFLILMTLGLYEVALSIGIIAWLIIDIYDRNCPPSTPLFDLRSSDKFIYRLSESNYISDFGNCPCLQG